MRHCSRTNLALDRQWASRSVAGEEYVLLPLHGREASVYVGDMSAPGETALHTSEAPPKCEPSLASPADHSSGRPVWRASAEQVQVTLSAHRFELLCSTAFTVLALFRVGPLSLPLGIGGLYALMAQSIQNAHFLLPVRIPYYGPGGIPFAYPPVALYVLAALAEIPGTSILLWLRYMPVIMCALSLWPVYGLYRELLPSVFMARIATILFAAFPAWLAFDLWADGSVRAFAFFWGMLTLLLAWRAFGSGRRGHLLGACVCFGIAIASHPEVAVFLGISLLIFAVTRRPIGLRFLRAATIMAGGAVIASPWWATVLLRTGAAPFLSSMHSHGGVAGQLAPHLSDPARALAAIIAQYAAVDPLSVPIYIIALLGFARCLRQGAWTMPLWTLALCILMPEGQRFIALGVAGAAAVPLAEIPLQAFAGAIRASTRRRWIEIGVLCLAALYSSWHMWQWEFSVAPELTRSTVQAARWLRVHSSHDARFLAVSDVQDQPEWFPFLARRTAVMGHWGAEWTPGYPRQTLLIASELQCAQSQSYACLRSLLRRQHLAPDYLMLVNRERLQRLQRQIASQSKWRQVYINSTVAIWEAARSYG